MRERTYLGRLSATTLGRLDSDALPERGHRARHSSAARATALGRALVLGGILISPVPYIVLSIVLGVFLTVASWNIGPIFAIAIGVIVAHEMLFSFPLERAARREHLAVQHLPLCVEVLGERISAGVPLAVAMVEVVRSLPQGPLKSELDHVVRQLQRGVPMEEAIEELAARLPGTELRMFCVIVKTFCMNGAQSGEPLLKFSTLIRDHRLVTDAVCRKLSTVRQMFAVGLAALCIAGSILTHYLPAEILHAQDEVARISREVGALLIIGALAGVMRLTARRAWEVSDAT